MLCVRSVMRASVVSVDVGFMSSVVPVRSLSSSAGAETPNYSVPEVPQGWKGVQRFYDSCGVRCIDASGDDVETRDDADFYQVLIDGRVLRTNGMNELVLPSYDLALYIAGEFASQKEMIHPPSTPLYNLACLAIDTFLQEEVRSGDKPRSLTAVRHAHSVAGEPGGVMTFEDEILRDELKDFLETDTVCYRAEYYMGDPEESILRKRQDKYYDPLIEWYNDNIAGPLAVVEGIEELTHPSHVYEPLDALMDNADCFMKASLRQVLGTLKSTVISLAFLHGHIGVDQAFDASRVEEEFQIDENGFVFDGHDTSRIQTRVKLASVAAFMWMLPQSRPTLADMKVAEPGSGRGESSRHTRDEKLGRAAAATMARAYASSS